MASRRWLRVEYCFTKVKTLMASIDHLQKENLRLKRGGQEFRRTEQYKQVSPMEQESLTPNPNL